jgi:hypothetical protein
MSAVAIIRRLGTSPKLRGSIQELTCPDLFELSDGSFAVIGTTVDSSHPMLSSLPKDAGIASYESMVIVPRETLLQAKADIPDLA